jgi:hypothetical protein
MAKRNRLCIRFVLFLCLGLSVSSPLLADGLPTYTVTGGSASFSFDSAFGFGSSSFSVTGPGVVASGGAGDPAFSPNVAPPGTNIQLTLSLTDLTGAGGSAVAGGTAFDDLFFSGFAAVTANVVFPTSAATLRVPATWDGSLVACTPSFNCMSVGGMNTFNLNFTGQSGVLTISFDDAGGGMFFDSSASFTTVPEPSSTLLLLLAVLASRAEILYRYLLRQLSGAQ